MTSQDLTGAITIIGGGVVGAALAHTFANRGVDTILLEREPDLAYAASGTNSGIVHTGFDSTPGELETELILRAAKLRPAVLEALHVPVLPVGAELRPTTEKDRATVRTIAQNAARNGVEVSIRESDGALLVPGESVTDPVAFAQALGRSAGGAGARLLMDAQVVAIGDIEDGLQVTLADGRRVLTRVAINAAGLHADEVARLVGDESFEIYPRKGEFFVFELPGGRRLERILLPVPTERTKGVLVFPTLDGRVVAGPTAHDQDDKDDWTVRPEAREAVLAKAAAQFPELDGLEPVARYAGLRPAGRGTNYEIGPSPANPRLINVAAIRSTGLTAALGIADYVAELLQQRPDLGVSVGEPQELIETQPAASSSKPWWRRTAEHVAAKSEGPQL